MEFIKRLISIAALAAVLSVSGAAQAEERSQAGDDRGQAAAKQLGSRDALVRQRAAEELAERSATDQRRLLEGYRLQEKNSRVRLALDWALYRVGKAEALFAVVRDLDSSRSEQAASYLATMDDPAPLYLFLERANGNTQVKLLEVLAKVGDAGTAEKVRPYAQSFDPKIAEAARKALAEIEGRNGAAPENRSTRPRQVGSGESSP